MLDESFVGCGKTLEASWRPVVQRNKHGVQPEPIETMVEAIRSYLAEWFSFLERSSYCFNSFFRKRLGTVA
eukprot:6253455-Amphidinium_carterae.1